MAATIIITAFIAASVISPLQVFPSENFTRGSSGGTELVPGSRWAETEFLTKLSVY